jgi:hypothetical protein
MFMFEKFKTNQAISRLTEEKIYEQVAEEIQNGIRKNGLWAKAIAEAELNDEKAKAIYIKLRVQSIIDEINLSKSVENERKEYENKKTSTGRKNIPTKREIDYSKDSIGTTERELTCLNCNRIGKMLIKKKSMTLIEKILFGWLGGIPGMMIGSLISPTPESTIPFLGAVFSYICIYFILFNKNQIQCPNCGNKGEIN